MASMLVPRHLRELHLAPTAHPRAQPHLSAASGLVCVQGRCYVVADDEHHLGMFEDTGDAPLQLLRVFAGDLPADAKARKALKPDLETLTLLPALPGLPSGALLALGSGSTPARQRGLLIALDASGQVNSSATARVLDLADWYAPLREEFADLNIEGAFAAGGALHLLQRGNQGDTRNAYIRFDWGDVATWLADGPAPRAGRVTPLDLGEVQGVALGVTDATPLPGGAWALSAVAENTTDSYHDGACMGSAIAVVDADGRLRTLQLLQGAPKVEGIAAALHGNTLMLTMVTDADNPAVASQVLSVQLPWG